LIDIAIKTANNCAPHQQVFNTRFIAGLERHGQAWRYHGRSNWPECDLAVFWSHRAKDIIEKQQAAGGDYLVAERGYMGDRMKWTSLGFNGLNGRAEFHVDAKDSLRFQQYHFEKLHPWKDDGDYILIMGQVHGDASIDGVDIHQWASSIVNRYKFDCPVYFRPHPLSRHVAPECLNTRNGKLRTALAGARAVITYNSNSGVDAVLAGVPTVATDRGSMVWDVSSRTAALFKTPNRTQWAAELAWCQWLPEEIKNGDAWDHLKQRYA